MDSFERYNTILDGKKPDRIPFYIPTIACSVASEILGREAHTGGDSLHFKEELSLLNGEDAHTEFVEQHRRDLIDIYRELGCDVIRETWRCRQKPSKQLDENTLLFGNENGFFTIKRYFPQQQSYGVIKKNHGINDTGQLKSWIENALENSKPVPENKIKDYYRDHLVLKEMARPYFPTLVGTLGISFVMDDPVWLEASALEQELLGRYIFHMAGQKLSHVKWLKDKGFRFINGGQDIAATNGPVISPESFEKIFVPALKIITKECRKHNMIYCYKTDGNIWKLSDMIFIDAGVKAYAEVDRDAGMSVGKIRSKYPDVIILGNISSQTLSTCSIEQVREETRKTIEESGGCNYLAGPSNAIVHGTPAQNVYAMAEEVNKFKL